MPDWKYFRSFEESYFPDSMVDRMRAFIAENCTSIYEDPPYPWLEQTEQDADIPINTSLQFTCDLVNEFFPEIGASPEQAIAETKIELKKVAPGEAKGCCPKEVIYWDYDETVSDIIYIPHEAGHLIGNTIGSELPACNISEMQSHFLQYAGYEKLIGDRMFSDDIAQRAHLYREHELKVYLYEVYNSAVALERLKSGNFTPDEKEELDETAQRIHYKTSTVFIAAGLWHKFKNSPDDAKPAMIDALYRQGRSATPYNILSAFDLDKPGALEHAMRTYLNDIGFSDLKPRATAPAFVPPVCDF
jgi:hypothetical protein